jgi:hypothetical protein
LDALDIRRAQSRLQMDLYKRALDEYGRPFPPTEVPMRREVFVASSRTEAIRLAQPSGYVDDANERR